VEASRHRPDARYRGSIAGEGMLDDDGFEPRFRTGRRGS